MNKSHYYAILVYCFVLLMAADSFGQFTIDAQVRPRFELRNGYQRLIPDTVEPAIFFSQRTRLSFGYTYKFLKVKITPQDVRVWGDEQVANSTGVYGDVASLDLFEGFVELRAFPWGKIVIGRQQWVYDSERLLSCSNWNQAGVSYDGLLIKLGWNRWALHLGGSWNALADAPYNNYYPPGRFKSIDFAWLNWDIARGFRASLTYVAAGATQTDTTNRLFWKQTAGFYGEAKWKSLKCWADGFYQFGRNNQDILVSAFLFDISAEYAIKFFTPGFGISYLSGNRNTGTGLRKDNLFDVLYGTRHTYFGYMDYFRNFPKDTRQGGLVDYFLTLKFQALKKVTILDMPHYFTLAQTNPTTPSVRELAFENDLVINYKFVDWGSLEGGYMFLLPTPGFRTMQGVENNAFAQFFYVMLTISPNLFTYPSDKSKAN